MWMFWLTLGVILFFRLGPLLASRAMRRFERDMINEDARRAASGDSRITRY